MRKFAKTTGAQLVALYLLNHEENALRLEAAYGDTEGSLKVGSSYSLQPQARPGFHSGHTARAVSEQSTQVVTDVFADVEFLPWRLAARNDGWVVSVPLTSRGRTLGALDLYIVQDKPVQGERLEMLEAMASLVAPAIENRRGHLALISADDADADDDPDRLPERVSRAA